MPSWGEGYFTASHYTYGYFDYLSPVQQRFALLLNGLDCPPGTAEAQHCELGFGQGVSLNVHSASNPGSYTGTDFTPDQVVFAAELARRAGNTTLRLFDDSFADFHARDDLPQFDSISMHGIWSWVSGENRRILMDIVRKRLKPGGILYLSYNCLPGWANIQPLQRLMELHDRYAGESAKAEQRVDRALGFVRQVLATEPAYAHAAGTILRQQLDTLGQDRRYLAHEYLNRNWTAPYFCDVAQALAELRLDFGATSQVLRRLDALYLTHTQRRMLAGIDHPIVREQVQDYCVNERFRTDLFVRGAVRLGPEAQRIRLFDQRVALCVPEDKISYTVTTPLGTFEPNDDQYGPVREALAGDSGAPKRIGDIVAHARRFGLEETPSLRALLTLMGTHQVYACQPESDERLVRTRSRGFNRAVAELALEDDHLHTMASPVTGAGVSGIGRAERLFILALFNRAEDPVAFAWQALKAVDASWVHDGKTLEGDAANLTAFKAQYTTFRQERLPLLQVLGVL